MLPTSGNRNKFLVNYIKKGQEIEPVSQDDEHVFRRLIDAAATGDAAAIAEVVRLYEPEVRRTARALLGPALQTLADSVDLSQSIHRSILWHIRKRDLIVTSADHLRALALTMVRRKISRQWQRRRRELEFAAALAAREKPTDRFATHGDDPAREAERSDLIAHALAQCSADEQQLIELRLLGHTTAEAARILGQDADVLRVRLNRLRAKLNLRGTGSWI